MCESKKCFRRFESMFHEHEKIYVAQGIKIVRLLGQFQRL